MNGRGPRALFFVSAFDLANTLEDWHHQATPVVMAGEQEGSPLLLFLFALVVFLFVWGVLLGVLGQISEVFQASAL